MALNKNSAKPSFEDDNSELGAEADAAAQKATPTADERVAAALAAKAVKAVVVEEVAVEVKTKTVAVVAPAEGSLAVKMSQADPFKKLENSIRVDYNTLDRIQVTNGNIVNKETNGAMGETCTMELISIQKLWVMSPGGDTKDEESLEFLKYSDDGKVVQGTGEPLIDYLEAAKAAGYDKARIVERLILVGMLIDAGKLSATMNGTLVQLDCAPRSKSNFEKHRIGTAFGIGKGLQQAEGAEIVKITAELQAKGSNKWTDAVFSRPK